MQPEDTSPSVQQRMDAAYRRMSPIEKIRRMAALTGLMRSMALARIRAEHPEESEREHRLRLLSRSVPKQRMIAAFGWDPDARR